MRIMPMTYPNKSTRSMTSMLRHRVREKAGQAFVELALVLPIFLLLLVGAVEVGRLAFASIEVSNAARAAVAYAARSHITAQDTANIQLAATNDAKEVTSMTTPNVVVSQSCSCESTAGVMATPGSCAGVDTVSCPSPSRIVLFVQVTTTASVNTVFHFPGIPNTVTLRGYANMRTEE
jgi:Flp pilus assembly protein TadG